MWGTRHSWISFVFLFLFHGSKSWRSITLHVEISIFILKYYKPPLRFLLIGFISLSEYIYIFFNKEDHIKYWKPWSFYSNFHGREATGNKPTNDKLLWSREALLKSAWFMSLCSSYLSESTVVRVLASHWFNFIGWVLFQDSGVGLLCFYSLLRVFFLVSLAFLSPPKTLHLIWFELSQFTVSPISASVLEDLALK